jgi:hypothetical protein
MDPPQFNMGINYLLGYVRVTEMNIHCSYFIKTRSFKSNLHREVGFFIRTHIKKSLKNVVVTSSVYFYVTRTRTLWTPLSKV